ncbi:hypothetical protein [Formosa maritima]|uniref:DUF1573 domain-containing protein n=1 Tax=Formosa maritima TaxID=2592046 RepID=A0A5D0G122_9FLAO|nr:hypothetical protein [Formosa maritima]TYA52311.1 hypothetical protein FVF61_13290 [Formosa maritima]
MKCYLLIVLVFISGVVVAQDSTNIKIETPKIVSKLPLGKIYNSDEVQIKFVDVLTDSRCPKDVTCVWAGEVVILVDILQDDILIEQKKIVFQPGKSINAELMLLFSSKNLKITAYSVLPNPSSKGKIKKEDYYLQLDIEN